MVDVLNTTGLQAAAKKRQRDPTEDFFLVHQLCIYSHTLAFTNILLEYMCCVYAHTFTQTFFLGTCAVCIHTYHIHEYTPSRTMLALQTHASLFITYKQDNNWTTSFIVTHLINVQHTHALLILPPLLLPAYFFGFACSS